MITKKVLFLTLATFAMVIKPAITHAEINADFHVLNAESIEFTENSLDGSDTDQKYLSFTAFDKNFDLVLEKRNDLMNRFSSKLDHVKLYAGKIEGVDKSWARLTIIDGVYSGAIYDGEEMYLLDIGKNIADAMVNSTEDMHSAKTVIYKASEVSSELNCGSDHDHKSAFSYKNLLSQARSEQVASASSATDGEQTSAATAARQINLRIVADTRYAASSPNGAEAQVLSQMNIVDGIFQEQLDVQFGITDIEVLNNDANLTSFDASTLLGQFRTFTGNNNPGLSHLFTGRDINGGTIGIAFISGICRSTGVGVTQAGGRGTIGALTAAHEFGHNFGSPHDNQGGSVCASTPGTFLMNPSINGSNEFSQCSVTQMLNTLDRVSCLVDVDNTPPQPEPEPEPQPEPVASCNFTADFANGTNGFSFIDDRESPIYTSGTNTGGALNTNLGGVDNDDISDIEGIWRATCSNTSPSNAIISLNAAISQTSEYEANEFSQVALRVNGSETVLATITGDGNGGSTQTIANQEYTVGVSLDSGVNTIELVCFNNLKTFANEETDCNFTSITSTVDQDQPLLDTNFNSSTQGFRFVNDAQTPIYSDGERNSSPLSNNSQALVTILGGVDNDDITDINGRWTQNITTSGGLFTLSFDGNLIQSSEYEDDEFGQIGIMINNQLRVLDTVTGNGNGGPDLSTGLQTYTVRLNLPAGEHSVSLYCANNEKTFNDETTTCVFDNVVIE